MCVFVRAYIKRSFRLENLLTRNTTRDEGLSDLEKRECYDHLSLSIEGHKRALEFVSSKLNIIVRMIEIVSDRRLSSSINQLNDFSLLYWRFVKSLESFFSYSLLIQCGLNVICMSICLYQVSRVNDIYVITLSLHSVDLFLFFLFVRKWKKKRKRDFIFLFFFFLFNYR